MAESILGDRAVTTPTPDERRVIDAVREVLRPMLESEPQMVRFDSVAKAAIRALGDVARVPIHRGPSNTGGADVLGGHGYLDFLVDARADADSGGVVVLGVALGEDPESTTHAGIVLDPTRARQWLLAALAACDAAQRQPEALPPLFGGPENDPQQDCATMASTVTLTRVGEYPALESSDEKDVT